ncbi:MAG: iron-containing alcohol dehydrogenase, partial [Muribaculaceae bacterium]|nr:iron-containing alcohol dehydrogenase [Muribaculaceae bacterium]
MTQRFILNEVSYFGPGSRAVLPEVVSRLGKSKVLVVTDAGLVKFGVAAMVTDILDANAIPYEVFSDVKPNPTVTNVKNGLEAFRKAGADLL